MPTVVVTPADKIVHQSILTALVQNTSPANAFTGKQQATAQATVTSLRNNSLTLAQLSFMQSLLSEEYQRLATAGPYHTAELAQVKQALLDVRSSI